MALHGFAWLCMALHGFAWLCMALLGVTGLVETVARRRSLLYEARLQEAEASQASLTEELQDLAQLRTSWRLAPSVLTILVPSLACLCLSLAACGGSERESIGKQPSNILIYNMIYIYKYIYMCDLYIYIYIDY